MQARGTELGVDIAKDKADKALQSKQMVRDNLHKHATLEHQANQNEANRKQTLHLNRQKTEQPPPEETE